MPRLVLDILSSHDRRSSDTFLSLFPTWVFWSVINGLLLINQAAATSMTISRMTRMAIFHGEGWSRLKSSGTLWRSIEVSLTAHNLQPRVLAGGSQGAYWLERHAQERMSSPAARQLCLSFGRLRCADD